jgi:DNA-directed RNA polymerase I, II, and III subunit RPABC2
MSNDNEVANIPNDYNVENSLSNLEENVENGNREVMGDMKSGDTPELQTDLKMPTYKKIVSSMAKVPKKTIPILTKYEKARIIGVRMQQLASGAKPCVDTRGLKSVEDIAYAELNQRTLPFIVKRVLPNGVAEYWKMEEFLTVS